MMVFDLKEKTDNMTLKEIPSIAPFMVTPKMQWVIALGYELLSTFQNIALSQTELERQDTVNKLG